VTLTGAGGIGKTRLAMAVARRLLPRFGDGVWVVDFSSVSDPSLVPVTIAVAAGMDPGGTATRQYVARVLAVRPLLLVLDTCEHVAGAVAAMAEELLRASVAAYVIATSREPLRAEGEWIYPVLPLAVPAEDVCDDDLQQYGAVRLFVQPDRIEHAAVLLPIKAKPFGWPRQTRPALTGRARGGCKVQRSGRKNARGADRTKELPECSEGRSFANRSGCPGAPPPRVGGDGWVVTANLREVG
jgi:hypothetical protein